MGLFDKKKESEGFRVEKSAIVLPTDKEVKAEGFTSVPVESNAPPTTAEVSPTPAAIEEAKSDFKKSADELEEARAGRNLSDIPLNDSYWAIQNAHTIAHGAHALREDALQTIKGKALTEEQKNEVVKR